MESTRLLTLLPLVLLLWGILCQAAKTQLALSAGNGYRNFRFDIAQRCYSLNSCYDNEGSFASWMALKDSAQIALYAESQCQGEHVTVNTSPRGSLKLADVGFDKKVSSFMLWETGTYPLRGFLDICRGREYAKLNSTNEMSAESTNGEGIPIPSAGDLPL